MIGDLVVDSEKSKLIDEADIADEIFGDQAEDIEDEEPELPYVEKQEEVKNDSKGKVPEKKLRGGALLEEILVDVTEENIHNYTLKDVVLPLVGYKIKFP